MKVKRCLFALLGIGLGIIGAVLLAELGLRFFLDQKLYSFEKGLFQSSTDHGYGLTPRVTKRHSQPDYSYEISANAWGFRGKEPNPKARYRVLVMGDSYGMGQGVPEGRNLCDRAQATCDRQHQGIDIFNTSLSGYSTWNELQVLKRVMPLYKPHLAIVLLCWNDIEADETLHVEHGYLVMRPSNALAFRVREWLNNHSRVFCMVKKACVAYARRSFNPPTHPGYDGRFIDREVGYFQQMKRVCDAAGSQLQVVFLPVNGIYRRASDAFEKSKSILKDRIESEGLAVDDWSQAMTPEPDPTLTFKRDGHWNEQGHLFFSVLLLDIIKRHHATCQTTLDSMESSHTVDPRCMPRR